MADLITASRSDAPAVLEKFENGVRREICGAFSRSSELTFRMTTDPSLGIRDTVLRIQPDGEDWFDLPFSRSSDGSFTLTLKLSELCGKKCGGLFFYEFLLIAEHATYFTDTADNNSFKLARSNAGRFTLLVTEEGFKTPAWFKGGVMYHIFIDRFCKGRGCPKREDAVINPDWDEGVPQYAPYRGAPLENNEFFGGTLWGVLEKLDYLSSLGVTVLYLSPIFEAYSNHKYDTGDYRKIDDMFGGEEAFSALLEETRTRGMHVILDGVFNHTGSDSRYFNAKGRYDSLGAAQSESSPYRHWYRFNDRGEYEAWWGIPILPRLNHGYPPCADFFLGEQGIGALYIRQGASGWRLDVADELSDDFLDRLRISVKRENPDAILIGEIWENAATKTAYGARRRYLLGAQLDSVMNYPFRSALLSYLSGGDASFFAAELTELYATYPRAVSDCLMNLLGTHDTERILSVLGDKEQDGLSPQELAHRHLTPEKREHAKKLLRIAAAIQYTVYGIPSVFYGDEAGLEGYHDPFCRRPFPWKSADGELTAYYRQLGEIRASESLLATGEFRVLRAEGALLVFERKENGKAICLAANAGNVPLELALNQSANDLLTGESFPDRVILPPYTARILKPC